MIEIWKSIQLFAQHDQAALTYPQSIAFTATCARIAPFSCFSPRARLFFLFLFPSSYYLFLCYTTCNTFVSFSWSGSALREELKAKWINATWSHCLVNSRNYFKMNCQENQDRSMVERQAKDLEVLVRVPVQVQIFVLIFNWNLIM